MMAEEALESTRLLRWSGLALVAGGVLLAVAKPLHPSRETPTTIIASEVRLVASHVLSALSSLLVLLGLPGRAWAVAVLGSASLGGRGGLARLSAVATRRRVSGSLLMIH
jgi:hypothetical protein